MQSLNAFCESSSIPASQKTRQMINMWYEHVGQLGIIVNVKIPGMYGSSSLSIMRTYRHYRQEISRRLGSGSRTPSPATQRPPVALAQCDLIQLKVPFFGLFSWFQHGFVWKYGALNLMGYCHAPHSTSHFGVYPIFRHTHVSTDYIGQRTNQVHIGIVVHVLARRNLPSSPASSGKQFRYCQTEALVCLSIEGLSYMHQMVCPKKGSTVLPLKSPSWSSFSPRILL